MPFGEEFDLISVISFGAKSEENRIDLAANFINCPCLKHLKSGFLGKNLVGYKAKNFYPDGIKRRERPLADTYIKTNLSPPGVGLY